MTAIDDLAASKSSRRLFAALLLPILAAVGAVSVLGPFADHRTAFCIAMLAAGGCWIAAIHLAARRAGNMRLVVAGAIALRVLAWAGDPRLSDDAYRYVWEGELVASGVSPYAWPPDSLELEAQRVKLPELYARVNHPGVSAAYPPLTQIVGAFAVLVARAIGARSFTAVIVLLRALDGLCDLLVLWPLAVLARRALLPVSATVAWAWSPLVALEFAGAGHFDSFGILLLLGALALFSTPSDVPTTSRKERLREIAAIGLFAGAVLVKYLPLVALPWLARRPGAWKRVLGVLAVCSLGFVPFVLLRGGERGFLGGIGQYSLRWESTNLVYRWIEVPFARLLAFDSTWTDPRRLARAIVAGVWLLFALRTWSRVRDPVRACAALFGAFLVLSPTLHPWYLAWIVPFVVLRSSPAWSWLVAVAPLLYWPLLDWQRDGVWIEPAWLRPVVVLPFAALLALEARAESLVRTSHRRLPTEVGS